MLVDFHNHTELCNHATGKMEDYVKAAIRKGISIFGFADHSPWMPQDRVKLALSYEEVPVYISRVRILQERYNDRKNSPILIRLGMEMDFVPDRLEEPRRFLKEYDFDYVIGSVHYIGSWGFDQEAQINGFKKKSVRLIYETYFHLVRQMIQTGLFDIVGHLDLVKKFGYFPHEGWDDLQEETARLLGESGMVVELNTSGMDKPAHEFFPGPAFLKQLKKYSVPVTLSSDSHDPLEVGRYFDKAVALLKEVGYREVTAFKKRKKFPVLLD
jgi:histidinol-phosphatase (PHP family)